MYSFFTFSLVTDSTLSQCYLGQPISPTIYHEVVSCLCIVVRLFCQSLLSCILGFPGGTMEKNLPANPDDSGSGWVRSPGLGNGNSLLYSCLENPMGRRAWWASVHGVTKSWAWLSNSTHTGFCHFPKRFFFLIYLHWCSFFVLKSSIDFDKYIVSYIHHYRIMH